MFQSLFVSNKHRAAWRKVCAGFLMLSLNVSVGGLGTVFLTAQVASAATVLSDSFGTGGSVADIPLWDESEGSASSTIAQSPTVSGEDTVSPDGGRFAKIGEDDSICIIVDGRDSEDFTLSYLWRGDPSAEDQNGNRDVGVVEVRKGSSCTANNDWHNVNTHKLDAGDNDAHEAWSSVLGASLGSDIDNSKFALRFRSDVTASDEHFRVDGIQLVGEQITYALTVNKLGNGTGSVTSSPAGISCGVDCSESYNAGTPVTLTAVPTAGSTFTGWSGACTGTGTCVVTMSEAKTVNATFTLNQYTLTVSKAGTGSGSVSSTPIGVSCGVDCSEAYNYGTSVVLAAAPAVGSTFAGWSGGGCSGTGTCTTTITAAITVTATFTLMTHTLSVHTTGGGAVTSVPAGISCGMSGTMCGASYDYGTEVTLTPIPDMLSTFAGWGGDCTGTGSCVVTMDDVRDVSASFTTAPPLSCPPGTIGIYPDCAVPPPLSCDADISSMIRVSNGTDVHVGSPTGPLATPLTYIHTAWTASIPGATWIWSEEPISAPTTEQDSSFFDVFTITGTPTAGTLAIAADNTYEVYLNSVKIGESVGGLSGTDDNNFQSGTQDVIPTAIIAPNLVSGQNTLEFRVRNKAGSEDWHGNPAGLLYKLSITKNACEPEVVPACAPEVNLVQNGGFESPAVTPGGWDIIPFSNTALKWLGNVFPGLDIPLGRTGLELQASVAGAPHSGAQLAELDGDHPTRIYQDIATIPGNDYSLSYYFSPRPGTPASENILEVALGGSVIDTHTAAGGAVTNWTPYTKTFVATSTMTRVAFADIGNDDSGSTGGLGSYLDDVNFSCVGPHIPKTTIVATKVVCDAETDLPNWSYTDHAITASTAADYVAASGGHCRLAPDWKFQWAPTTSTDPGDTFTGEAPLVDGWHTFGPTDGSGVASAVIEMGSMTSVWMREVLKPGYIPFTFHTTNAPTSAEMYCSGDVKNYDNLDYAQLADGSTQYCVAFNAPVPEVVAPHCDLEGYKYMGEGESRHGVPDVVVGVMDMPSQGQEGECDGPCRSQMHLTKTDESGHYCFADLPRGPHHVFEIAPVDTELVQLSLNGNPNPYPGSIDSFFDIFTELHLTPPTPETMDSFFDVFVEIPGVAPHRDSFFDVFTELELTPPASIHSFFDVFVDVDFQDDHIDLYNRTVVIPPTNNGGGGGSTPPQCADGSDNDNDGFADLNDGGCESSLDNDESGSGTPPENGGGDTGTTTGEVLGAATTTEIQLPLPASCAANPYLRDYLKMGKKNDPEQVKLLQIFLNENMSAGLPVTGYFGPLTKMWVKKFQKANHAAILQPWIDAGFDVAALRDGTGNVFKTTKYYINKLKCAELNETMPPLTLDGSN